MPARQQYMLDLLPEVRRDLNDVHAAGLAGHSKFMMETSGRCLG
jgi:hypothetical protein